MLTIGRIDIEDAATRAGIRDALAEIHAPDGAHWRVHLSAAPGGAFELVADGPRRLRPAEPEWTLVAASESEARYRRRLTLSERRPSAIRAAVRKLVWEQIEVRENAIAGHDADVAEAVEHVVWDLLSAHELPPVQVRLGSWGGSPGQRRYVCKIEAKTPGEGGVPPWRWWSPIVSDADEVATWLQEMLRSRGLRLRSRVSSGRPSARTAAPAVATVV